jgi:hypothetical protein
MTSRQPQARTRVAKLAGQLGCAPYAGTARASFGSWEAIEPAFFAIAAVDSGHGGGAAGDRFAFTVFFDPQQAPLNHAIFGPKPTFTGAMVAGEVTIAEPVSRPLLE